MLLRPGGLPSLLPGVPLGPHAGDTESGAAVPGVRTKGGLSGLCVEVSGLGEIWSQSVDVETHGAPNPSKSTTCGVALNPRWRPNMLALGCAQRGASAVLPTGDASYGYVVVGFLPRDLGCAAGWHAFAQGAGAAMRRRCFPLATAQWCMPGRRLQKR